VKNRAHFAFFRVAHGSRVKLNSRSSNSKKACGVGHSSERLLYKVELIAMSMSSLERTQELPTFFAAVTARYALALSTMNENVPLCGADFNGGW
jgi:hypothetical protein